MTVDGVTAFGDAVMTGYEDLVTDENGTLPKIDCTLPAGTYQLREKAPAGYVILTDAVYFDLAFAPDGSAAVTLTDDAGVPTTYDTALVGSGSTTLIVKNTPGVALPDTGGPGVTLIYLVGAAMMGLAGALLVKRRRTSG